ncbi:hypothetical protein [Paraclostridium sordellii]|uniref:hypothetical protein n=1 Tax=Paraclostridium sordellii TaxID=1505 RepID=UPI0005E37E93|nr:hypothetical protein [Paeniclostridium sordellii]CEN75447.1 Uncharacterised protein [[Clostridium] sordellii] [Paeniclostridium sordellii]CEO25182.1 Uncharacterised protein [[Clostridium] sordellii] [Paeniclostridium sordellii]
MNINKANIELKSLLLEEMEKENISFKEEDLDIIIVFLLRVIKDADVYDMLLDLDT